MNQDNIKAFEKFMQFLFSFPKLTSFIVSAFMLLSLSKMASAARTLRGSGIVPNNADDAGAIQLEEDRNLSTIGFFFPYNFFCLLCLNQASIGWNGRLHDLNVASTHSQININDVIVA